MKKWLALLFLLFPALLYGQGARIDNFALKGANPISSLSNANVTLCTSAGTGNPCTPLATTYTDSTLGTACMGANQIVLAGTNTCVATADVAGNYGFWVAPGKYILTITAPGLLGNTTTTTLMQCPINGNCMVTGNNTHSGTETFTGQLNCKNLESILCADQFSGSDTGAQLNSAYANSNGSEIWLPRNPANGSYLFSTPIAFSTAQHPAHLTGLGVPGSPNFSNIGPTLEYTPITNTCAITLDYMNNGGGSGQNPGAGISSLSLWNNHLFSLGGTGTLARGVCLGSTNGADQSVFRDLMISGFNKGVDGGSAPAAWNEQFYDTTTYANAIGLYLPNANEGISEFGGTTIFNGIGVSLNNANYQSYSRHYDANTVVGIRTQGFSATASIFGAHFEDCCNTVTLTVTGASINGANVATYTTLQDPTGWEVTNSTLTFAGFTGADTFFNQICTVTVITTSTIQCPLVHGAATATSQGTVTGPVTAHFADGASNFQVYGGDALDGITSGVIDHWFDQSGLQYIGGLAIASSGRTATHVDLYSQDGWAVWLNNSPALLQPCPNFATTVICADINALQAPFLDSPIFGFGTTAGIEYTRSANGPPCPTNWVLHVGGYPVTRGCASFVDGNYNVVGDTTNQNLSAKTLIQPVISTGISQGSGLKHQRFVGTLGGTCPSGAAIGATCTSAALSWATAFSDTSYTVTCSLVGAMTGQPHIVALAKLAASITVQIAADTAAAANVAAAGAVECIAMHD